MAYLGKIPLIFLGKEYMSQKEQNCIGPLIKKKQTKEALKTLIKGAISKSYCCYDNLSCQENNNNVFTNDWAEFCCHDCSIN